MKKFKILILLMMSILLVPFGVFAEEDTTTSSDDSKVNIYFFRGEGCSHCQEAEEWFESIQDEYGQYFTIKDYETWYDEENADLMQTVADARGEEASGVPYIIIGNKSWNGFAEDYEEEILEEIKSQYETDPSERYDIMELIDTNATEETSYARDFLVLVLFLAVIGAIGAGVVYARKKTA